MPNRLDDTLNAMGFAKVLVTLADGALGTADEQAAALADQFIPAPQADDLAAAAARATGRRARPAPLLKVYPRLGLAIGYVNRNGAAGLRASARVHAVDEAPELSLIRPVKTVPFQPPAAAGAAGDPTWGVQRIRAPELWAMGFTGRDVRVAHLDTGVDGNHPAFVGAIAAYAEFDFMGEEVPGAVAHDTDTHGTHTAGTILGRPTAEAGAFGVAPDALLVSATVIEGGNVVERILAGMEWSLANDVRILSMSLGLRGFTSAFQAVVDALRARNVLPVIAVGNEFANSSRSPGNYVNLISVGASDSDEQVADFSSSQTFNRADDPLVPDLVAPGVDTLSSLPGGGYGLSNGSSMATPHVAGLAALLAQAEPGATASQLEAAILQSCVRPGTMPQNRANRGVPDGVVALQALQAMA